MGSSSAENGKHEAGRQAGKQLVRWARVVYQTAQGKDVQTTCYNASWHVNIYFVWKKTNSAHFCHETTPEERRLWGSIENAVKGRILGVHDPWKKTTKEPHKKLLAQGKLRIPSWSAISCVEAAAAAAGHINCSLGLRVLFMGNSI